MDNLFNSSLGVKFNIEEMVKEIISFMKSDENRQYKILIGTDSEGRNIDSGNNSEDGVDFVTAVVMRRVGNGGRYFWRRLVFNNKYTLRNRIIQEVLLSLEAGKEILTVLKSFDAPHFDFEIHVDVGEAGETKSMIQELLGMIRAYNFEAKTKPESYAASNVADRCI